MSTLGFSRGQMRQRLMMAMWNYDEKIQAGGTILYGVGHMVLPGTLIEADLSFTSKDRVPMPPKLYMPVAPDIAMDIVRNSTVIDHIPSKVKLFLRGGTSLVWIMYPDSHTIVVHTADGEMTCGIDDILDAGDVLPGFTLPVRDIFPE